MLRKITVGAFQANCYILGHPGSREGLVIDPGAEPFRIIQEITRSGLKIIHILITHAHMDHVGGVGELRRITKAPVLVHALDRRDWECGRMGPLPTGRRSSWGLTG